jgi:hypothetical protein
VSAEVLTESKRRLRALEFELGERMVDEVERSNATKYHKVKHFGKSNLQIAQFQTLIHSLERKKTDRKIRQAKKKLADESDVSKKAKLQGDVDLHELHRLYILHYPKTMPYVSLYPQENADDKKSVARKESILKDIKDGLLKGDSDLKLFNQQYRNVYKDKMITKGIIPAITPVAVDEDVEKDKSSSDSESESEDEKDDFFEKAQ